MNKEFSRAWATSTQARKQRKYRYNAPLHLKRKFLSANLAEDLRKEFNGRRSAQLVKGDTIKVMRGDYKGEKGEVTKLEVSKERIFVSTVKTKKVNGTEVQVPLKPSNVQIVTLNRKDTRRVAKLKKEVKAGSSNKTLAAKK